MVSCGGLVTRLSAGYQPARSLPSCPTKEHLHAVEELLQFFQRDESALERLNDCL